MLSALAPRIGRADVDGDEAVAAEAAA
jgi:hypothetical protein